MNNSTAQGQALFDDYLAKQEDGFKQCLIDIRNIILAVIPGVEETFSYQTHCFKHVYMLVGIGTNKNFCSLYTMSPPLVKQMKNELKGYGISGATIHFKPNDPLPEAIITKIVLERIKMNEVLAMARKKK